MKRSTDGSALITVLLLASLVTLAGLTLALVTQQERGLSRMHARELRLQRAALDALRAAASWFENPTRGPAVDQTQRVRLPLDPQNPQGPPLAPVGEYKAGIDLDEDGADDLFRSPYRGVTADRFLGHPDHPDLAVFDPSFLAELTRELFGADEMERVERRRVERIVIHAPPTRLVSGAWQRHGLATVAATVVLERRQGGGQYRVVGRRRARAVLQEVPYRSLSGPMVESCGELVVQGPWSPRWGQVQVAGDLSVEDPLATIPTSLPAAPSGALWSDDGAWVAAYSAALDPALSIPDPWLRVVVGGSLVGSDSVLSQPWPHTPPPMGAPSPWDCCGHSHVVQHAGPIPCEETDYDEWKALSQSALSRTFHYRWVSGDRFRSGDGVVQSVQEIFEQSAGQPAFRFFDTTDGKAPSDADLDGVIDNLTPPLVLSGDVTMRGLIVAHAQSLTLRDLDVSSATALQIPGEPKTPDGSGWVDLQFGVDRRHYPGGAPEHASQGGVTPISAAFEGVLIQFGDLSVIGRGNLVGRFQARNIRLEGEAEFSAIFPNPGLRERGFLPDWQLPRFVIAEVAVD